MILSTKHQSMIQLNLFMVQSKSIFIVFLDSSIITCVSSSGTISLSRCQLFEAGCHPNTLHLRDESCKGSLQDGRRVFHFNNDDQLCGTVLKVRLQRI